MSVAGRTRRGPTVTSYQVPLPTARSSPSSPTRLNEDLPAERSTTTVSPHDVARAARAGPAVGLNR
jgi:hypothetical protein